MTLKERVIESIRAANIDWDIVCRLNPNEECSEAEYQAFLRNCALLVIEECGAPGTINAIRDEVVIATN